ncbi:MAG TPA: YhdP family protein [Burkholderiaceae bacterium]|jgi:uncharacterized protein (TIGR02099 family)
MSTIQDNLSSAKNRFAFFWRAIKEGYRYFNIATHHTLGAVFKLLIAAYFIFCILLLTLRYSILPNISQYKGDIEQVASKALGKPVSISTIQASWHGLRPYLSLNNVVIHDQNGQPALTLPNVSATLSWWSVMVADVRLHKLEINQPDMDIRRDANGNLYVAGIFIDTQKTGDGKGVDWILSQNEIAIHDGRLRWNDGKRGAPELALTGVNLVLRNNWRHHQLALKAIPPASFAAPLDIRADFEHPRFSKQISDFKRWKGEVYVGLEKADLTVWKPYVNYPIELQKGEGAVFAWLKFDYAKVVNFTADLTLVNVATRLSKDVLPLDLVRVNGRVSIREEVDGTSTDAVPTLGRQGHSVSLTDFSFATSDGLVFPATTLSESYTPAKNNQQEKIQIQAKSLDLRTLAKFAEHLPLPAAQRQMLVDYAPRGQVKDFSVQWQGTYPQISSYHVKGNFVGLSLNAPVTHQAPTQNGVVPVASAQIATSGFENLTGSIDADDHSGSVNLKSPKFKLLLPGYFIDPVMPFDQLNMRASWAFQPQNQIFIQLQQLDIAQEGLRASLWGTHQMSTQRQGAQSVGTIDMAGRIYEFDLKKINRVLPLQTPEKTRKWLIGALEDGKLKDATIRLQGDLANFPFRAAASTDKKQTAKSIGEFSATGRIENAKLNYAPGLLDEEGTSPLWPAITDINGTITFDRTRLEVKAASAKTSGADLSKVKAVIPDLWSPDMQLSVDGVALGALQNIVKFTKDSPVARWIGHFTNDVAATGNATLGLKLQLPLMHIVDSKVQGDLHFDKNDITLQDGMPPLLLTTGTLEFNEQGINLPAIKANLLGLPFAISGGTQHDGTIRLKADGGVSAEGLRKTYTAPAAQRFAQHLSGSTRFSAQINIKKRQPEIIVDSTLQGMALDLPVPLRKTMNEHLPLRFELNGVPSVDGAPSQDEIRVALGPMITAHYLRQKSIEKNAGWRVMRGGIGFNAPPALPDSGLLANVNLRTLDLDAWSNFVDQIVGNDKSGAGQEEAPTVAQYIVPDVVAARSEELMLLGRKLDNVVVGASHLKGMWQSNIDSEQVSGYVTWNESPSGRSMGKVTARLTSLIIPQSATSGVTDLLAGKKTSTQIPALDVVAENFELAGKKFGHLELAANNAFAFASREWRIKKLSIINPDGELSATGKWSFKDGENDSNLVYQLDIFDAGKLLERLGFPNILRNGKGKMSGDISWKGLPFSFDMASLSGGLDLDLKSAQFLKVDPSAAKLLGVLSLQSLPRRLLLDFRDVFSEGFAFDSVAAHADVNHGVLKTDSFKMKSVSATVAIEGTADLLKETTDLHVILLPDVNVGAASVAYLLVNPVVGVSSFLAQLFFRAPLTRALTREYRITGPWNNPVINELDRKSGGTAKDVTSPTVSSNVEGVPQ